MLSRLFAICCLFTASFAVSNKSFPADFMFGAATASYQVEGGWDADGKGEGFWDRRAHTIPYYFYNNENGDVACDSYHKYKEDVALLKDLGVNHYRFSISWARVLPEGFINNVNQAGLNYYKNLIKELLDNGIEPLITLYHWDLPQGIEEAGGFLNEDFVDWFGDYARLCFESLGDSVKYWTTFNELKQICWIGYGLGRFAPDRNASGIGEYKCSHNGIKAHARAWHIYDTEYRSKQNGQVGMVIDSVWYDPATNSTEDQESAEIKTQFSFGWYGHPITFGDYPDVMKTTIANRSKAQGFARSRLPEFSEEEKVYIKGTYDFLGINCYSAALVNALDEPDMETRDWAADSQVHDYQPDEWPTGSSEWLKVTPWAIRRLLAWVSKTYSYPDLIVTETGYSDSTGVLEDNVRINYYRDYLSEIRDGMEFDGIKLFGFTAWSLMDNVEWNSGYSLERFGLYHVDFASPNRTRTPKKSAEYYKKVIQTRCLVDQCE